MTRQRHLVASSTPKENPMYDHDFSNTIPTRPAPLPDRLGAVRRYRRARRNLLLSSILLVTTLAITVILFTI
jgi:hypothetical protein